jgi:serine phosphatase RsbU (regulator of sigma subunit)
VIVLYSDGITDQPDAKDDEFGRVRLAHTLLRQCGKDPDAVADAILSDLAEFTGDVPMHDDQTLIVLRVK